MLSLSSRNLKLRLRPLLLLSLTVSAIGGVLVLENNATATASSSASTTASNSASASAASTAAKAVLTVNLVKPKLQNWSQNIVASGNVLPWQESIIGAQLSNLQLAEVHASVGDTVKKGQLLASFADESVTIGLDLASANLAEAQALHAEAVENLERMRKLGHDGALSKQQISHAATQEQVTLARVEMARANLAAERLRKKQARVLAPDDGVISARSATSGAVMQAGQELFRLIRKGRLEWRAEVTGHEIERITPGASVMLHTASGKSVAAKVRTLGPSADQRSRNVLVYVDLPEETGFKPGMFARGEIRVGSNQALALPGNALVLRDGLASVFVADANNVVKQVRVKLGREVGGMIEVEGIRPDAMVVAAGAAFLSDGDLVRVSAASSK